MTRIPISGSIFARSTSSSSNSTSSSSTTQPLPFSRRDSVSCARAATTVAVSPNAGASSSHHAAGCGLLWTAYVVRTIAALDKLRDQGTAVPLPGAAPITDALCTALLRLGGTGRVGASTSLCNAGALASPCEFSALPSGAWFGFPHEEWLWGRGVLAAKRRHGIPGKRLILEPARPVGHRAGSCPATTP
eukprot:COSAG06_NODE_128_length_22642_cov_195.891452_15_plen_190_part_00